MSKPTKKTTPKKTAPPGGYRPDKKIESVPARVAAYRPKKKIESVPARVAAYRPENKTKSEREAKMSDQEKDQAATIDALKRHIEKLERENSELKEAIDAAGNVYDELAERHHRLEVELEEAAKAEEPRKAGMGAGARRYVRGVLPGNKLIRIDTRTNTHEEVSEEEWNAIQ